MEKLIIKMVNEHYKKEEDIKNLLKYIGAEGRNKKKEKLLTFKTRGTSQKKEEAVEQLIGVQKAYGKTDGRRVYQLIVIFPKEVKDRKYIKSCADKIADMLFARYQVVYGIHTSTENWHIHYAINAVSYKDGKKWHKSKVEFKKFKEDIQKIVDFVAIF